MKNVKISRRRFVEALVSIPVLGGLIHFFFPGAVGAQIIPLEIPLDKKLDSTWFAELLAKGTQKAYTGNELTTIGMPCGGIGAGQVYVRGDGTLAKWWIFNNAIPDEYGELSYKIASERSPSPIDQGFSISTHGTSNPPPVFSARLDQTGFDAIQFIGEYPIATIRYLTTATPKPPVEVTLEVFSPHIPLNAKDSALPGTIMHFSVLNTSPAPVTATLTGWLKDSRVVLRLLQSNNTLKGSTTNDVDTTFSLNAGEKKDITFIVAWYHSSTTRFIYNTWFNDASAVANYIAANYPRLYDQTHLYRDTYFNTTLPYWFVQRVGMPVSTLATETSQWWNNGRFYGFEGVACCPGTCTHVYNYAQAMAYLFPELERSVRTMQDLAPGIGFNSNGQVNFRGEWPGAPESNGAAVDGQCGTVLKVYREHLMSADGKFLDSVWTNTKQAMEFAISLDNEANGIIDASMNTTYDCHMTGRNTFVGGMYLAALRAAEEMAKIQNDPVLATRYHTIFQKGKTWSEQNLWANDRFIQDNTGGEMNCQYGNSVFSDQLFGQTWAHLLNLGSLYEDSMIAKALTSIYNYNWAPDCNGIQGRRVFAGAGERGLIVSNGGNIFNGDYTYEVWSGIEYQVASCMIARGQLANGMSIIRGIHDRYNGTKHNPWNEVECGEHYSRAMASWGALLAITGFIYDGPAGTIGFVPQMNQSDFRSFFSSAQGWGTIAQRREANGQQNDIEVKYGTLKAKKLVFDVPANLQTATEVVTLNNTAVQATKTVADNQVTLALASEVVVNAGDKLSVSFEVPVGIKAARPATPLAVRVYPGMLSITGTILHSTDLSVALFDLHGKMVVKLFHRTLDKGSYDLRVDLNKHRLKKARGSYILKAWSSEGSIYAERLIMR